MADEYLTRQLPKWLRAVELEPGGERLAAIESAANDLAGELSGRDILDMTLLAHGRPNKDAFDRLSDTVQEHDSTFGCRPDDLETKIAAGATLSALLTQDSMSASVAAQGILSAKWLGLSPAVVELPELAHATSHRRSEALRGRRTLLPSPGEEAFFDEVPNFDTKGNETNPVTQQEVRPLRAAAKEAAEALQTRLDAADEELDLLWWAFSGYSELAKTAWASVAPETAAVLCGIEFGKKLMFEIELPSTDALLARLLGDDLEEPVSLASAVEGCAPFVHSIELPDGHSLLPILSSISEHRALDGKPSWSGSVDRWNIDPTHSAGKLAFARQSVRESALTGNI